MNLPLIIFSQILSLPVLASIFSPRIRLTPALILQVAVATELFAVLKNIGVFPAGTLATLHSQNVTILTHGIGRPLKKLLLTVCFALFLA
jgi:hypothetical protein